MNSREQHRQKIIQMTKNPLMTQFTGERIVERLTEKDLVKIDKIMKKNPTLNITSFLRIMRNILIPNEEEDFYLTYGLFRFFQEICIICKRPQITFQDFSTTITQKMPSFSYDARFSQKLYPMGFDVPESIKKKISAPQVVGKVLQQRQRLQQTHYLSDRFIHLNRRVCQSFYSPKMDKFLSIDSPSTQIMLLNSHFDLIRTIHTEQELSKRDSIITYLAWSQHEQRLAALLGNYSISLWAVEDNFRFEVNVPLPLKLLLTPYAMIGYMQCSRIWYAIDNRPAIYILSHSNYQPEYVFTHFKMIKEKQQEKMMTVELKYRKLLCFAFQRNVFLISLEKRELVTQLRHFTTNITSIVFSQTYQALFVSNFQNEFHSFQLTEHLDLTHKGKFQGHKNYITLVGVLQNRPVVYSIDQTSVAKLWDIRDFTCYQSFTVLKNIQFRQSIALPDSICLIGSKHFCYRWLRYHMFQESQKIIDIAQLEKNILVTTSKEVRVYSHSNGVLIRVLKGIFNRASITKAKLMQMRKLIVLMNEEGLTKMYSTKDFTLQGTFELLPKPIFIYYQKETQLVTTACMGQIRICELKDMITMPLKRRIHNRRQIIRICQVSPLHDLIAIQYQESQILVFYSYQRTKMMGFITVKELVMFNFFPQKNVILALCKDKLIVYKYNRGMSYLTFYTKAIIPLWQTKQLQSLNIFFHLKPFSKIQSASMLIFDSCFVIVSNDACVHCIITYDFQDLNMQEVVINRQYYNPYRIASEDHLQTFDPHKNSQVFEELEYIVKKKKYYKHPGNRIFMFLSQINLFYAVGDQTDIVFYDLEANRRGIINFNQTLPLSWDLHNYSEQQFKQLEFVLQFIQQEKIGKDKKPIEGQYYEDNILSFSATSSKTLKDEVITMSMLRGDQKSFRSSYRSTSLREKKIILEKERDEKEKQENFQQMLKAEQIAKLKNVGLSSSQKYASQSIAFLNVNRNKMLLARGAPEVELPQIKALQHKLNVLMNSNQKKSMVSRYSGGQQFPSTLRESVEQTLAKSKAPSQRKLLHQSQKRQSYKDQLKRLDLNLRQSKYKRTARSGSLPTLRHH